MTHREYIGRYLTYQRKIDDLSKTINRLDSLRDDATANLALLATTHSDELTPLRDGQIIEVAHKLYLIEGDIMADVAYQPGSQAGIVITLFAIEQSLGHFVTLHLDPEPGKQWRYPADNAATLAAPQEVRS